MHNQGLKMLERCCACNSEFLTEADPYIIRPTKNGVRLYCSCYIVGCNEFDYVGKNKKLEAQLDKATTMIVNHEAKIGYMKESLEKIRDDRSPQWDPTDLKRIARECLEMLYK